MSRRQVNPIRRFVDSGIVPFASSLHQKSRSSPLLSIGLVLLGAFLLIGYSYSGGGFGSRDKEAVRLKEIVTEGASGYLLTKRMQIQQFKAAKCIEIGL